ncbi:uncharacterized protein A4U43_UnF5410 [Asparagus officinalis]|uniref:Uncharacterized protein n=1 Tax=Asparagus officinalis TaxID=4686 RepID=A0A1R3L6P3_ASPOF|nr:uncharacterized protein A4U43_UnF5410 [Asparagus officinalis]
MIPRGDHRRNGLNKPVQVSGGVRQRDRRRIRIRIGRRSHRRLRRRIIRLRTCLVDRRRVRRPPPRGFVSDAFLGLCCCCSLLPLLLLLLLLPSNCRRSVEPVDAVGASGGGSADDHRDSGSGVGDRRGSDLD